MTTQPDWYATDKAYQLHHATCPQCRAAGLNPRGLDRCPVGADLWASYQAAGNPPHFTWLARQAKLRERAEKLRNL